MFSWVLPTSNHIHNIYFNQYTQISIKIFVENKYKVDLFNQEKDYFDENVIEVCLYSWGEKVIMQTRLK